MTLLTVQSKLIFPAFFLLSNSFFAPPWTSFLQCFQNFTFYIVWLDFYFSLNSLPCLKGYQSKMIHSSKLVPRLGNFLNFLPSLNGCRISYFYEFVSMFRLFTRSVRFTIITIMCVSRFVRSMRETRSNFYKDYAQEIRNGIEGESNLE